MSFGDAYLVNDAPVHLLAFWHIFLQLLGLKDGLSVLKACA